MLCSFECVLEREDDVWSARFPQIEGAVTSGKTRDLALKNASELLKMLACESVEEGPALPEAQHVCETVTVCVTVTDADVEASKCMTMADAARELGVRQPRVSQLVSAGQLDVVTVNGQKLVTIASVRRYASSRQRATRHGGPTEPMALSRESNLKPTTQAR